MTSEYHPNWEKCKSVAKWGMYSSNFFTPALVNVAKAAPKLKDYVSQVPFLNTFHSGPNIYSALGYGMLDILGSFSPKIKDSKLTRFAQLGGALFHSLSAAGDVIQVARGDLSAAVDFCFNAPMAWQLGKDTHRNYAEIGDILDDLSFKDVRERPDFSPGDLDKD